MTTSRAPLDSIAIGRAAVLLRCVSHPLRLTLLAALASADRTVSELQRCTGAGEAQVAAQLAVLRWHRVVAAHREGRVARYSLVEPLAACVLGAVGGRSGAPIV